MAATLNSELDRTSHEAVLMEMLDIVTDAQELLAEFCDALEAPELRR